MKRFSLSRNERIRGKKAFSELFNKGTSIVSGDHKIRVVYIISGKEFPNPVMFAVAVPKRNGNAVWRNRIKRLIRESYRLHKHGLISACEKAGKTIQVVFLPVTLTRMKNPRPEISDIEPAVVQLLELLCNKLT